MEFYRDPSGKLNLEDIRLLPAGSWHTSKQAAPSFAYTRDTIWMKFRIRSERDHKYSFYLEQAVSNIDQLEIFIHRQGVIRNISLGDHLAFNARLHNSRGFIIPQEINPGETLLYYIKEKTTSPHHIRYSIWERDRFISIRTSENQILFLYYGFLLALAVYNLFVFFSVRDRTYLYYVVFIFGISLFQASINGFAVKFLWPGQPWWANIAVPFFISLATFGGLKFLTNFLDTRHTIPRTHRVLQAGIFLSLLGMLSPFLVNLSARLIGLELGPAGISDLYIFSMVGTSYLSIFFLIASLTISIWRALKGQRTARFYVAAEFSFLVGSLIFAGRTLGLIPTNFLSYYGIMIGLTLEVTILSLGLADRINTMRIELKELNNNLENKVQFRTAELQNSLLESRKLRIKQDADYFLTATLLTPLSTNNNNSDFIQTDILVEQQKKFKYRDLDSEIGGDICITDNLSIHGKQYMIFICADAMGKSIQGAGGALVLGASFKAHLQRSKNETILEKKPEEWLQNLYNDLQYIFRSFEGSMLIALSMGLVEESTGDLFYIRAEHPQPVLYRSGRADFLENKNSEIPQLGVPENKNLVKVATYNLLPGDILFFGSDGRDDIRIKKQHGEDSSINSDETLFLKHIESTNASIHGILEQIKEEGQLIDDVSLLKITYTGGSNALWEQAEREIEKDGPSF